MNLKMDHLMDETVNMEGYLERKIQAAFYNWWKKYWFVLRGKTLNCYKSEEESKTVKDVNSKVFLNFVEVQVVRPAYHSPSHQNDRFVVEIVTRSSTIKLAANNEESRKRWLRVFHQALDQPLVSSPLQRKCTEVDKEKLILDQVAETVTAQEVKESNELIPACFSPRASAFFTSEQFRNWPHLSLNLCDEVLQQVDQNNQTCDLANDTNDISDKVTQTDFSSEDEDSIIFNSI